MACIKARWNQTQALTLAPHAIVLGFSDVAAQSHHPQPAQPESQGSWRGSRYHGHTRGQCSSWAQGIAEFVEQDHLDLESDPVVVRCVFIFRYVKSKAIIFRFIAHLSTWKK